MQLAALLKQTLAKINLIQFNSFPGSGYIRPDRVKRLISFMAFMCKQDISLLREKPGAKILTQPADN